MSWRIIHLRDVAPSPWRNGGGVTRELVAWPTPQDWVWRQSVAEVAQSGPFSKFEGVQRWFAVLGGAGVRLILGERTLDLTSTSAPLCFEGEQPVNCTLIDGTTQDFNLMLRRDRASARMRRVCGEFSQQVRSEKIVAIYATGVGASVHCEGDVLTLPPATLAWRYCPASATLRVKSDYALCMEIEVFP